MAKLSGWSTMVPVLKRDGDVYLCEGDRVTINLYLEVPKYQLRII